MAYYFDSLVNDPGGKTPPLGHAVLTNADVTPSNVSDEAVFIVSALQDRLHGSTKQLVDDAERIGHDWAHVFDISDRHRVVPPLYAWIRDINDTDLPEEFVSQLQSQYRHNGVHSRYQAVELCKIFEQFRAKGINAISYKGPTLAQAAYGDLSLRSFADLDILVQQNDLRQAVSVLLERGYTWRGNQLLPPKASITGGPLVPPLTYEWKFDRQRDLTMVELGWQLHTTSAPTSLGFETLWDNTEGIDLGEGKVTGLSPEDRLLVLAHHGATHRWGELKWIYDFAVTINGNDCLEWQRIIRRARKHGLQRRLYTALGLTSALFGVPEDGVVRSTRSDETAVTLAADIIGQFLTDPLYEPSKYREFLFRLRSTDTIRVAASAVTEPLRPKLKDYQWVPLPQILFPIYYLMRPIRLTAESVRSLWTGFAERGNRMGSSDR